MLKQCFTQPALKYFVEDPIRNKSQSHAKQNGKCRCRVYLGSTYFIETKIFFAESTVDKGKS